MKLTTKIIADIDEPGRYGDDAAPGLYLIVQRHASKRTGEATLRKSFMQRLTIHGKRHDIGLGTVRWGVTTISAARRQAIENYRLARMGGDPLAAKRSAAPTFEVAAEAVIALHSETWKDAGKSEKQWRSSLAKYAMPRLGQKTVDRITTADVLAVLMPHWNAKRETMRRVRQRIGAIMKWAIAEGHRTDNPAGDAITAALPRNGVKRQHQRALDHADVSAALDTVRASGAYPVTGLAFEFLVLTATRSGEVRGARWDEVDFDAATWTVPGERMKAGNPHRVPLSDRAVAVLQEARGYADGSGLVFPSVRRGKPLSDSTLSRLLRETGVAAVPHGFRSSFRQWAAERTNAPREVAEEALAHINPNRVEAAYQRSDLFERRRDLMDAWAQYIDSSLADVLPIRA